ncbi:MAG TPA: DUF2085 domain-containing protein [Pyrinomonadaceae bacterium]|nr:DUF2085 domain-containing protein [Pyrinomonadaceae bacterium]
MRHEKAQRRLVLVWVASALTVLAIVSPIVIAPLAAESHLSASIYRAFGALCHQLPERSYFIDGHKLAVCSRCTGLYAGFAFAILLYPLLRPLRTIDWPPREWLILSAVPMAIDVGLDVFGIWENTHTSRLLTGVLLGSVSVFYVMPGLAELSTRKTRTPRTAFTLTSPEPVASAPSDYSAPERRI